METLPPHLQKRTDDLLLELRSELGKDAANQFISIRSAIYYGDNSPHGIHPQVLMGPGSPNQTPVLKIPVEDNT
jgi:hypothetical protein